MLGTGCLSPTPALVWGMLVCVWEWKWVEETPDLWALSSGQDSSVL